MDKLEFSSVDDFGKCVIESLNDFTNDEYPAICVYGKFEFIKETLETLLTNGVKIHNSIELEDFEISGYDKEFELMLTQDGVAVSKMWHEDNEWHKAGYYDTEANIAFVHEDCNSKILTHIASDEMYEFAVGECECSECKCKDSESACKKDEKSVTASSAATTYKINNKEVTKEEFDKKYEEFEEMYLDNIRDMLLGYCSFMDEVNEWRSRLLRW